MKKLTAFIMVLTCVAVLTGCSNAQKDPASSADEVWDLLPMVMVDGTLYLDTGYSNPNLRECGMFDGEITSSVDGSERPTIDDQSNFGSGYGYQYGATEGTIEIYMNNKWWIYATEEVREEVRFQNREPETIFFHDKTFNSSDLSRDTYKWLVWYNGLSEAEQLSVNSIPSELYELCGYAEAEKAEAAEAE